MLPEGFALRGSLGMDFRERIPVPINSLTGH